MRFVYDRYEPPAEPTPDDPAPTWERFEPAATSRPATPPRQPRPTPAATPGRSTRPSGGMPGLVGLVAAIVAIGGILAVVNSGEPDPTEKPDGWDACVAEEARDIETRGGSLLTAEDFCAIRYPSYEWEDDASYDE